MKRSLIFILCYATALNPASLVTISESGTYQIGANLTYNSTSGADTIILINTSNVVLDLNNKVLTQGNPGTPILAGVAVAANVSNVKIKNGTINNITGSGLLVQSGDQGIIIDSVATNSCTTGFNFQNARLAVVKNCVSLFATTGNAFLINASQFVNLNNIFAYSTSSDAVLIQGGKNCSVQNAIITKGTNNGISITTQSDLITLDRIVTTSCQTNGINLSQSTNCNISNFAILNCATSGNTAFNISNSSFLNIIGCKLLQNGSTNALTAINISGCSQSLFQDIMISSSINNNSLTGILADLTSQTIFKNCNLVSSNANGMLGFFLNSRNTTSCVFEDCSVANCISFPGGLTGFLLGSTSSPNNIVLKNCNILNSLSGPNIGGYNVSASPAAFYYFENCNVKNNSCSSSTGNIFNFNNISNLAINESSIVNNSLGADPTGGAQGFKGIELINSSLTCIDNVIVSNCSAQAAVAVTGIDFGATLSCHLTDCQISNGLTPGSATGINLRANPVLCNLIRCVSNNNSGTTGAVGFSLNTTTSCSAQDCEAIRNSSIGFSIGSPSFITLVRNSASGQLNNNFNGFNANNFVVPAAATDTNSSCTPWTNFGING